MTLEVLVDIGGKFVAHHVVDGNIEIMALFAEKLEHSLVCNTMHYLTALTLSRTQPPAILDSMIGNSGRSLAMKLETP